MNPIDSAAADACGGPPPLQSLAHGVDADALEYLQERWELPSRPQVCLSFLLSFILFHSYVVVL